jgi:putative membrane protein
VSERRLHPFSFLFAIADTARQILFPAILALFATRSRDTWEFAAVIVLIPVAAIAFGRTLSFRYRFDATELVIRSGFLFRRVRHIPYDRIQNVNVVQGPLHRMLDVIEVRIETGGGTELEAHLRVIDRAALDEIRGHVEARREPASADDAAVVPRLEPEPVTLLRLSPREVLLLGLIQGRGMVLVGALFGLAVEIGMLDRFFKSGTAGRGMLRQLARASFEGGAWPIREALLGTAALVLLLAVFRLLSALWTAVTYYGFTLRHAGDDLRCEYGLLTRVMTTIPIRRIQKLTVHEGPWHRFTRRVSLHVQTAGGRAGPEAETARRWLAPLVRREGLQVILQKVLPDAARDVSWHGVHPRGVRRELFGHMALLIPVFAVGVWTAGAKLLVLAPLALWWAVVNSRRTVAALRWAISDEAVHFASGWIWRTRVVAPLPKVQVVSRRQTPFDRRHAMASVSADTAGGRGPRENWVRIPYLPVDTAADLTRQLAAAAARTPFRW